MTAYLKDCRERRSLADNTIRAYASDIEDFCRYVVANGGDARKAGETYLTHLVSERELKPRTVRRRIVAVAAFLEWIRSAAPQTPISIPKAPAKRGVGHELPRTVEIGVLRRILDAARNGHAPRSISLGLEIMVATGLRIGELCSLRLCDFDARTGALRVKGKGAKYRTVFVGNAVLLGEMRNLVTLNQRVGSESNGWLLTNSRGAQLQPQTVRCHLKRLTSFLRIKAPVTPHMLRHTAATLYIERGVDIRFVQRMLGHSSIATTEIYTHVSDQALRDAMVRGDPLSAV